MPGSRREEGSCSDWRGPPEAAFRGGEREPGLKDAWHGKDATLSSPAPPPPPPPLPPPRLLRVLGTGSSPWRATPLNFGAGVGFCSLFRRAWSPSPFFGAAEESKGAKQLPGGSAQPRSPLQRGERRGPPRGRSFCAGGIPGTPFPWRAKTRRSGALGKRHAPATFTGTWRGEGAGGKEPSRLSSTHAGGFWQAREDSLWGWPGGFLAAPSFAAGRRQERRAGRRQAPVRELTLEVSSPEGCQGGAARVWLLMGTSARTFSLTAGPSFQCWPSGLPVSLEISVHCSAKHICCWGIFIRLANSTECT